MAETNVLKPALSCHYCGHVITDPDEQADPYRNPDTDEAMCSECYREHFEFSCCWCKESDNVDVQHKMLVIEDAYDEMPEWRKGVYQIGRRPYYADGMIEMHLIQSALTWIGSVPETLHIEYYPCGHLCSECQNKITETAKAGGDDD
jgi:hypothetical protein